MAVSICLQTQPRAVTDTAMRQLASQQADTGMCISLLSPRHDVNFGASSSNMRRLDVVSLRRWFVEFVGFREVVASQCRIRFPWPLRVCHNLRAHLNDANTTYSPNRCEKLVCFSQINRPIGIMIYALHIHILLHLHILDSKHQNVCIGC